MTEELTKIEILKQDSRGLRGAIIEELNDPDARRFSNASEQLLKFHGMYQQKDRDRRSPTEKKLGPKPFTLMIRGRIPGGRLSPEQWAVWDDLAGKYSSGGIRLTTRQSIQLHGILKDQVKETVSLIHQSLQTTTGACGDVVRNVTQAINPWGSKRLQQLNPVAQKLSEFFEVRTKAYFDIFIDGVEARYEQDEAEDVYGTRFLPRKFKIAVTAEGDNSVDIYTHDLAFVATYSEQETIDGFHVFAGGGMGMSHTDPSTFPRLADNLGWVAGSDLIAVAKAIVTTQRDFGNRQERSQARLKYTIDKLGVSWFRKEVETRAKIKFGKRALAPWNTPSPLGWSDQEDGRKSLGVHLLSGRIIDTDKKKLKTALRKVIDSYVSSIQVTAEQDLILEGIAPENRKKVEATFDRYGVNPYVPDSLFNRAVTCVALPTCVKALSESERIGEETFQNIQDLLNKYQLGHKAPTIRITGCPNGCARPYAAEIGLVGQLPGRYALFFGGSIEGTRLGQKVAEKLSLNEVYDVLDQSFAEWARQGELEEAFGDFAVRLQPSRLFELTREGS